MKEVNKKYLIIGIVTTLILCLGISVAYFSVVIRGEGKDISVTSKKLEVIFTDTETITASNIEPGWETTKTFSVENKTGKEYRYDIRIKELENTFFLPYLEYEITSTNGYKTNGYREIPKNIGTLGRNISIGNGETQTYTIKFRYRNEEAIDQSEDMGKSFSGSIQITETPSIIKQILVDNPVVLERTSFDTTLGTSTATDNTIYKANGNYTEDGSEVYYFAGNVSNNWVKFGQDENNNDLYWRIIRTNEDGGVRLLYAGTSPDTTEGYISVDGVSDFQYNTSSNAMYVGWMYGTEGSLENNRTNQTNQGVVKTKVDTWYSRGLNIKTDTLGNKYDSYISKTAIYCNDRSGDGYSATETMYYGAYKRIEENQSPSYRCGMKPDKSGLYSDASIADKFTVSESTGNGDLTYPVALMTADEVAMAGGKYNTKSPYTYFSLNSASTGITGDSDWWTMSPSKASSYMIFGNDSPTGMPGYNGFLYGFGSGWDACIRPVVSLKSCVTFKSGNGVISGDINTPYEVSVDNACAIAEN